MVESKTSFDASAAPPQPSAPPAEESSNLPVATPVESESSSQSTSRGITPPDGPNAPSTSGSATAESAATVPVTEETRQKASGIAAAVLGFFLGGPLLSLILGGGTYYAATQRPTGDTAGDAARSLGDVGLAVRDQAVEFDEKHNVVEKSKKAASSFWKKSRAKGEELNERHDVVAKGKVFLGKVWTMLVEFDREHRVLERTRLLVTKALTSVLNKLNEGSEQQQQSGDDAAEAKESVTPLTSNATAK